jgi:hypothetical protein
MHSFSQIEVKESRNASSLLPIKLASMISNLDLFAMVSGHVCADMMASRDGWEEDGTDVELWKVTAFRLSGLLRYFSTGRNIPISHPNPSLSPEESLVNA